MIINMSEKNYRAMDRTHIYSSLLKTIYSQSAKHLDKEREENDAFTFGTLAHMYILEPEKFKETTILQPEFNPISKEMKEKYKDGDANYNRTKECREQKEAFEASVGDKTVVSPSDMEKLEKMLTSIKNGNYDLYEEFLTGGKAEYTIVNDFHEHNGKKFPVKVRIDYFIFRDTITIVDVKTTQNASEQSFRYDIRKYGYDIQAAFYMDVVKQKFPGHSVRFLWVAIEKLPPYAFGWYECSQETYKYGYDKYSSVMEEALNVLNGGVKKGYKAAYDIVAI